MIFTLGQYIIDIDIERTRAFYREHGVSFAEICGCSDCINYLKAIKTAPPSVLDFFDSLGVDLCKAPEMFNVIGDYDANGLIYYEGFFHLVGEILEGEDAWETGEVREDGSYTEHLKESCLHQLAPNFQIAFSHKEDLLEEGFPDPHIQMEVFFHLPWILNENK